VLIQHLQHTATHCNTVLEASQQEAEEHRILNQQLQHTATHCNTLLKESRQEVQENLALIQQLHVSLEQVLVCILCCSVCCSVCCSMCCSMCCSVHCSVWQWQKVEENLVLIQQLHMSEIHVSLRSNLSKEIHLCRQIWQKRPIYVKIDLQKIDPIISLIWEQYVPVWRHVSKRTHLCGQKK